MTIKILSRSKIEELIKEGFPDKTSVISFRDTEDEEGVDFSSVYTDICKVAVDDLEYDELEEYDLTEDTYFPEVNQVAQFIKEAIANDKDIICQCEYGQGRSAGCAAAILEAVYGDGISIFSDYRYYPNKLIYNKLIGRLKA